MLKEEVKCEKKEVKKRYRVGDEDWEPLRKRQKIEQYAKDNLDNGRKYDILIDITFLDNLLKVQK